jgi:hypothetical protein
MLRAAFATRGDSQEGNRGSEDGLNPGWLCDRHPADGSGTGSQIAAARALRSRDRQKGARKRGVRL